MQAKVTSEQGAIPETYVGIDGCKERLDAYLHPQGIRITVANDTVGQRKLKRALAGYKVVLVVIEATSKYHRAIHRSLAAAGYAVAVVNPLRARLFAEAAGTLAKTDAIDARMLALMGERLDPAATAPLRDIVETVQELARARSAAIAERTALTNRIGIVTSPFLRRELNRKAQAALRHIARLEDELDRIIVADPVLARRHAILCSIPGIGAVTATAIIASFDEIGQVNAKQAAALAGLAPFARDSGARYANRTIRAGRPDLRIALYMAALSAARYNPDLKIFRQRLRDSAKPPKLAIIAVARKLLVLANTLIAHDRPWTPIAP